MGLTIHWEFQAGDLEAGAARRRVEELRRRATQLPFEFVGEDIEECCGDNCAQCDPEDGLRWIKILACRYLKRGDQYHSIPPSHMLAFVTSPGAGCEPAVFGLARYPEFIRVKGERLPTGLKGWSWTSFCKTQYASNPTEGGLDNFFKCHLTLVGLLDAAKELGLLYKVNDEGEYWQRRDRAALANMVERCNQLAARVAGQMKDAGHPIQAPITEFPNFEHLEAQSNPPDGHANNN